MNRRLYRCRHDKMLAGVAGGVAEYFDLDPSLVRLLFVVSIFFGGIGLLLYIGMAIIVPLEPISADAGDHPVVATEPHRHAPHGDGPWTMVVGLALIGMGALALLHQLLPGWDGERYVVPAIVIGIGTFLVARTVRREPMET
jgi:phage shock protein C